MTKTLLVVALLLGLGYGLDVPQPGMPGPNAVSFDEVRQVALNRAGQEFPGARLGTAVPYVDQNGQTVAWMFHFTTDGKPMPDYEQVAAEVRAGREGIGPNTDLLRWTSPYAHVLVSARRDWAPVLRFGYGASEFYAVGPQALVRAQAAIGSDARLSRIYFVYPSTYLEFGNAAGAHVVFSAHFERAWDSRTAFASYAADGLAAIAAEQPVDESAQLAYHARTWSRELAGEYGPFTEVFVPQVERAPFYDWSYGCTPTAGTMVLGYIDRTQNFGRLIDWFTQRWDGVEGENDYQIPNTQREVAIAMHTDTTVGGTTTNNIAPGLRTVASDNGYTWDVLSADGALWNDYCWDTLVAQLDSGHALVWSATWEIHSLACYGYRTTDKYLYVHNTWWTPAEWWAHAPPSPDWAHVGSPHPVGGDVHRIEITYPRGDTFYNSGSRGEVIYVGDTAAITWTNFGQPGTSVNIDYSTNGGRTWTGIVTGTPDNGEYRWYVPPAIPTCDSMRLRLKQYDNTTYTAGDGTFGNFRILREPLPPRPLAPPNGLPVMQPPVILIVDSLNSRVDSIEFKLVHGLDTIWHQRDIAPRCSLPDTLFTRNQTYKWIVRGHNQFGWGPWGATWSFRTMWTGIEEQTRVALEPVISVAAPQSIRNRLLHFTLPGRDEATLTIYDALGNVVADVPVRAGRASWNMTDRNGRDVLPGLYFARTGAGMVRKVVLVD